MRHNPNATRLGIILALACAPLFGQQYTISTIAGVGAAGISLNYPTGVAVDSVGDVYVCDWSGLIRKIWARNGSVTVAAGTGILGYSGDGGQATNAEIGRSINIAVDDAGDLYIVDGDNNRIRRVDAISGIITTVAGTGVAQDSGDGGPAVNAGVSRPTGITADEAGNLYFSNWSRVRKISAGTGIVETIAGQTITSFGGDGGPAVDALFWDPLPAGVTPTGAVYVADFENSRIRMIAGRTGIVTTVAGSGPCAPAPTPLNDITCQGGFGGDGGLATHATLNHAEAAALDEYGNLYIADTINHRIRRVEASTGIIYTIAGNGVNGFSGDGGPATAAEISFPTGLAVDRSGKIYFADENNERIRVLTPEGPRAGGLREAPPHRVSP
jgi:trimeric autotransporter adhesin